MTVGVVSQTTTSGFDHPYMFSTKRYYAGLGLYDFGYRFYSPSLGRWINRDPKGEEGGLNLYGMVGKLAMNWICKRKDGLNE